ncbi:MAG TPA: DUF4105 domain-containing protein, partial [Mariprofundaceae bacterium]|nr:DUF4105 domain-containing protein [Mariprofundaceae bacterium]
MAAFSSLATASSNNKYLATLLKRSDTHKLYKKPEWLALLHYHHSAISGFHSQAISRNFFLSEDGRRSPRKELKATLVSLFSGNNDDDDTSTQCRFPLRYHWLKSELSIDSDRLPKMSCNKFLHWRQKIDPASVTLVFPSEYMNAPSSIFGHTLLRFDPAQKTRSTLLSYSVSFAAMIPKGTSGSEYLLGGVDGKFPGRFQTKPYYQKVKEYGKIENRDIWEYRLNLSKLEVDRLLMHLWEIRGIDFEYYFSDENCSYRLMELLEIVRPESRLTEKFPLYVIPSETIREIIAKGFVRPGHHYRPSLATKLRASINSLTQRERDMALAISHNPSTLKTQAFESLPDTEKSAILHTVYRFSRWKELKYWRHSNESVLVKAMTKLPPAAPPRIPPPASPDQGHPPFRIELSGGHEKNNYFQIGIRPLYHDVTDNYRG